MRLEVERVALALREPLRAAGATLTRAGAAAGAAARRRRARGVGEAAPLEPYDGVPLAAVRAALDAYAAVLAEPERRAAEELLEACRAERDLPQALAAVDLALWDLAGKRAGRPVAELISIEAARSIPVNATIGAEDRAGAAPPAAAAAAARLRLREGQGRDRRRRRAASRRCGRRSARARRSAIDANGAWSVDEAIAHLRHLAPAGIELAEEPVHGVEALRAVRAEVDVPLAMDETAAEEGAPASGATDAVCLKIGRCGGISGVLRDAAARARSAGRRSTSPRPRRPARDRRAPCTPRPG